MSNGGEYFHNPNVPVTDVKNIAARGLTPEHIGNEFEANGGYYAGQIWEYEHRTTEGATYVTYQPHGMKKIQTVRFGMLDVLSVTDK